MKVLINKILPILFCESVDDDGVLQGAEGQLRMGWRSGGGYKLYRSQNNNRGISS